MFNASWANNDFLGLGYSARITTNFEYMHSGAGLTENGWVLQNNHAEAAINIFVELIIHIKGYKGFYWKKGGYLQLTDSVAIDYQPSWRDGAGRVVCVWSGTLWPNSWIALWYNNDAESGTTEQPVGAYVECYVREIIGNEDVSQAIPTKPPYRRRIGRDEPNDADMYTFPVSLPPSGLVDLVAYKGSNIVRLYHQLLNEFNPGSGSGYRTGWRFSEPEHDTVTRSMYQESVNGNGYLYLPVGNPSWDSKPHPISFEIVGSKLALKSERGQYLAWPTTGSVGNYDGALASYELVYTNAISESILWDVSVIS
ncbi:ORF4 [Maize-associated tombusvirus]|nr:ORF4 [Maize-associated tombusvirus]